MPRFTALPPGRALLRIATRIAPLVLAASLASPAVASAFVPPPRTKYTTVRPGVGTVTIWVLSRTRVQFGLSPKGAGRTRRCGNGIRRTAPFSMDRRGAFALIHGPWKVVGRFEYHGRITFDTPKDLQKAGFAWVGFKCPTGYATFGMDGKPAIPTARF